GRPPASDRRGISETPPHRGRNPAALRRPRPPNGETPQTAASKVTRKSHGIGDWVIGRTARAKTRGRRSAPVRRIIPAPRGVRPDWVWRVRPRAPARIAISVRSAVAPVPTSPLVAPASAVPTVPAVVPHLLDRWGGTKLDGARLD